jgi:hypothetical protein
MRSVMIQVRGTSSGRSLRSTDSKITFAASPHNRESVNSRCSHVIPLQKAYRAKA